MPKVLSLIFIITFVEISSQMGNNISTNVDWREIYIKYVGNVITWEGAEFGGIDGDIGFITEAEVKAIKEIPRQEFDKYIR